MPFQIEINPIDTFQVIQISDTDLEVSIEISTKGALLNHWELKQEGRPHTFIAGNPFEKGWKEFEKGGFRSAKMSPFVCRLHQGQYTHLNHNYTIEHFYLGEHAIHGIVYDALFTIASSEIHEHQASVVLEHHYTANDKGFPFNYSLQVKWTLEKNNKVSVTTIVSNQSETIIPMVDGWHPYFTLGTSIDNCTLQFLSEGKMEYDADLLPTGKNIPDKSFDQGKQLGKLHLDDGYLLEPSANECRLENDQFILTVRPSPNYPYLQLYTPPDRQSIAIENLSGAPNAFNNKIGLQLLKPYEDIIFETSYQVVVK